MKKYLSMIGFVIVLGIVASSILIGMNLLTAERIEANQAIDFRRTVLDTFGIAYSNSTINDVFEEEIEVINEQDLTYYRSVSGDVGFVIEGGGVWGPIIGFLVLEPDLATIRAVAVLQQQETPGLGGVVAEQGYRDTFAGVKVVPILEINKDPGPNKDNEVDAITGATRTSKAFETIINDTYLLYSTVWDVSGEEEVD